MVGIGLSHAYRILKYFNIFQDHFISYCPSFGQKSDTVDWFFPCITYLRSYFLSIFLLKKITN